MREERGERKGKGVREGGIGGVYVYVTGSA